MEKLTKRTESVLDILDEQIEDLEERLKKVQPLIDELNKLKQTRRVLLSEKSVTGGGGHGGPTLSMEEVVRFLSEHGPSSPGEIAEGVGFDVHRVRSHLSRHKDTRYENVANGSWALLEGDEDELEGEEE
jgi:predicted ArsR family transcriptional regulator